MNSNQHDYALQIDGPLLAQQRQLLLRLLDVLSRGGSFIPERPHEGELLHGVVDLLDEIADQAHDRHGIDSLLEDR